MNQLAENINKDMLDSELIDVGTLQFSDDQTWLYKLPEDSGEKVDMMDWYLSCDWPESDDPEYVKTETELFELLDKILKNDVISTSDKHKFDSRTFVRPRKRIQRPSLQNVVESPYQSAEQSDNKYLTYNKYSSGGLGPILRLKTFNVDTETENSSLVREYARRRRSRPPEDDDDDLQLEDVDATLVSEASGRLSAGAGPGEGAGPGMGSRPIQIDLSQPAHNLHNTFNKGMSGLGRPHASMFRSGESLLRVSPPSLVSSIQLDSSGTYSQLCSLETRPPTRVLQHEHRDHGSVMPASRESLEPMMSSMTLSILDERDMSTSFLSQSTYPEGDQLDSLPPSLVSSVNSSFMASNGGQGQPSLEPDTNIFSSATFTRLLAARPRVPLYGTPNKRDPLRGSESYIKSRDESTPPSPPPERDPDETITLHFTNAKFRRSKDAEKENLNSTFEKDDAFYKDNGVNKTVDLARNSLNVTLDKQELNEIIQARQKLSLARKGLPVDNDRQLPNQADSPTKMSQTITMPRQSNENASELLARRRALNGGVDRDRRPPERNATFKKSPPPRGPALSPAPAPENVIDINSATMDLVDTDRTLQQEEWSSQQRAMAGSSDSGDTPTFSSSSPPDAPPAPAPALASAPALRATDVEQRVSSTPLAALRRGALRPLHHDVSPIYGALSHDQPPAQSEPPHPPSINSATMVRRAAPARRDLLAGRRSAESGPAPAQPTSSASYGSMVPPAPAQPPRRAGLPTSKLRQYSSHRELSRIPGSSAPLGNARGALETRRHVYGSNPALSPTAPAAPAPGLMGPPLRRDSYTVTKDDSEPESESKPVAPPALVRQGTETLRPRGARGGAAGGGGAAAGGRPPSQLLAPRDLRANCAPPAPAPPRTNNHYASGAGARAAGGAAGGRPSSVPPQKLAPAAAPEPRPASGLPRPSRLPAPRRGLRPPSVYSVAPAADVDHY